MEYIHSGGTGTVGEEESISDKRVILVSSEGIPLQVAVTAISISELVKTMLWASDHDEDNEEDEDTEELHKIPVHNVDAETLRKIIDFSNYHADNGPMVTIETPIKSTADIV